MGVVKRGLIQKSDLLGWDGKTLTGSRVDATGGTVTGLVADYEVDVLEVFGSSTNYTLSTISQALQHIGSSKVTLVFAPGTWTIDADLTIPANLTCRIPAGCIFSVDAGKTLTINGHIQAGHYQIFSGSGSFAGFANNNHASLKWWGATIDGSTDDTTAVNAAIASADSIFHPGGICIVENSTLAGTSSLTGAGKKVSIFKLKAGASSAQILNTVSAKDGIEIKGIGFDANSVTNGICLNLIAATSVLVSDCRFTSKYGIYLQGASEDVQITGNTFDANSYGVITEPSSTTKNIIVDANLFKDCTADGVEINCPTGSGKNWNIVGNVFENIGSNGANSGFGVGASGGTSYIDGLTIFANTFSECDHQGVHIEDGCRNVSITGNTIKDTGLGGTQTFISGVYVAASVANRAISRVTITGNSIVGDGDQDYGLYIAGSVDLEGFTINNNVISTSLINGILLGSVLESFTCNNNSVYDSTGPGIRVSGDKGSICNNVCTVIDGAQTYGLEFNTGTDLVVTDNILTDNDTAPILITSGLTTSIVRNNRGWVTENSGTGTINSGSTSATITHGLSASPLRQNLNVTFAENPDNTPGLPWVDTITSTQFNVNVENDPGASHLDFAWQAIIL